jgi:hypothetical protein
MNLKLELLIFIIILLNKNGEAYVSAPPTWLTSPYFRAGNEKVIKTLTGNAVDPIYTFTFSSALPGVPNLAYGIKLYQGIFLISYKKNKMIRLRHYA